MSETSSEIKPLNPFERLKSKLRALRDEYSDEILKEIIHSYSKPPTEYKVRTGWWTSLIPSLELAILEGKVTDPKIKERVTAFVKKYTSTSFRSQRRVTTRDDIQEANQIVNLVLKEA